MKNVDLGNNATNTPEEPITFKRYDEKSKFWVSITSVQSDITDANEEKVLSILKKNYIERSSKK